MKRSVVGGTLLLAALIGGLHLARELRAPRAAAEPRAAQAPSESSTAPQFRQPELASVAAPTASRQSIEPAVRTPPRRAPVLEATIVVVDPQGVEHPAESGSIRWMLQARDGGMGESPVEKGSFRIEHENPGQVRFVDLVLGDRATVLDPSPPSVQFPPDEPLVLRARWLEGTLLHVLDLETRAELNDVTVVLTPFGGRNPLLPGDPRWVTTVVSSVASPIELPRARQNASEYRVMSPGHAWARAVLRPDDSGELEVLLGPAGDLEIELAGAELPAGARLHVRRPPKDWTYEDELGERRTVRLEHVPIGEHEIEINQRNGDGQLLLLARTSATVQRGELARAVLELPQPPVPRRADLSGVVVFSPGWRSSGFQLECVLLDGPRFFRSFESDELEQDAAHPERYHWRAEDVPAGRYRVRVLPPSVYRILTVEPPGCDHVELVIPPPAAVEVRVVDAATGEPVRVNDLQYWFLHAPQDPRLEDEVARLESQRRVYQLQGPVGWTLDLRVVDLTYRGELTGTILHEGTNELVLRAWRAHRLRLELVCEGRAVPWPVNAQVIARPVGEGEEQVIVHFPRWPLLIEADHPGPWIVNVPPIPGYEPLLPQTVHVGVEEDVQVFELTPQR